LKGGVTGNTSQIYGKINLNVIQMNYQKHYL
jgi:hypothetical protein